MRLPGDLMREARIERLADVCFEGHRAPQGAGVGRKGCCRWVWWIGRTARLPGWPGVSVSLVHFRRIPTATRLNPSPGLFPSVVAFRKSNKIGFFIKVIPRKEDDADVTASFKIRHDFRDLAAPVRPSEEGADVTAKTIWLTHHVELRLGPLVPWMPTNRFGCLPNLTFQSISYCA